MERRYIEEIWNKGNMALINEFLNADSVWHGPGGRERKGTESMKQLALGLRSTFPDLYFTVEAIVADGDIIMYRYTAQGTFTGKFMGLAPTGNKVTWTGFMQDHFKGSKIAESWETANMLEIYQQMGVEPPTEQ